MVRQATDVDTAVLEGGPRRPPGTAPRLPALDVLRAIGAMAVVGTHVAFITGAGTEPAWGGFLVRLDVGVAIFFVLSGFLLFRPFADAAANGTDRPRVGRYLLRRALRILPAYWLVVVAALLLIPENRSSSPADWLRYATLTQIYWADWNRNGLSQTWSLATEVAFYLVLPLVVAVAVGRRWRPGRALVVVAGGTLVLSAGWFAGLASGLLDLQVHTTWLPTYALWFAVGIGLAIVHVAARTGARSPRWRLLDELGAAPLTCVAMALGLYAVASTPITGPRDLQPPAPGELAVRVVLFAAIAALILVPAAFGPPTRFKSALTAGPARWLGTVSYGLFLWQLLVLEAIYRLSDRELFTGDMLSTFALTLVLTVLLATLSHYLMERPIMRWGARRAARADEGGTQPERGDREQPGELGAGGVVRIGGAQPQPDGHAEQPEREPRLQQA